MTDYTLLFVDDYFNIKDLNREIHVYRWERAYSAGILEQRLEKYDLIFLDLETGNGLKKRAIDKICSKFSQKRFYLAVKEEFDMKEVGDRVKLWNAGGYLMMPIEHEHIAEILRGINLRDRQLPFLNSDVF